MKSEFRLKLPLGGLWSFEARGAEGSTAAERRLRWFVDAGYNPPEVLDLAEETPNLILISANSKIGEALSLAVALGRRARSFLASTRLMATHRVAISASGLTSRHSISLRLYFTVYNRLRRIDSTVVSISKLH